MMFFEQKLDDAVSPVVGVILMVAVTVILAAVIGSFVLDLGNNVQANPQAGVTFSEDTTAGTVSVQVISMENADSLTVTRSSDSSYEASLSNVGDSITLGDADATESSGSTDAAFADGSSEKVTVVGNLDGKQAVIQTYTYSG